MIKVKHVLIDNPGLGGLKSLLVDLEDRGSDVFEYRLCESIYQKLNSRIPDLDIDRLRIKAPLLRLLLEQTILDSLYLEEKTLCIQEVESAMTQYYDGVLASNSKALDKNLNEAYTALVKVTTWAMIKRTEGLGEIMNEIIDIHGSILGIGSNYDIVKDYNDVTNFIKSRLIWKKSGIAFKMDAAINGSAGKIVKDIIDPFH